MTEEEFFRKNYPDSCYGDRPLSPHWDFFQDGAEFGYNKANEWHYVKDGDLPKEPKRYLCQIKYNVGGAITYECSDYDVEYNSWTDSYGDVIAWKEIVLPKESE